MTAVHISDITDDAIHSHLAKLHAVTVEWSGQMPADAESWDEAANERVGVINFADVRQALETCDICGGNADDEIRMALSIACEPEGLPDNAIVALLW
jgi:hypothetical protein